MKHDTFEKYTASDLERPLQGVLTAWDCLAAYRDDLVLVGGLAIRYLTHPPAEGLPGPVTLDVDFGVSIGASSGMYGSIKDIPEPEPDRPAEFEVWDFPAHPPVVELADADLEVPGKLSGVTCSPGSEISSQIDCVIL